MVVSIWSARRSGGTRYCGIRIGKQRDSVIAADTTEVTVELEGHAPYTVRLTDAFRTTCPEFRHPVVAVWLAEQDLLKWPRGQPPQFDAVYTNGHLTVYRGNVRV